MLGKLRPRSIYDVFAVLALVVAMGGTGAYAANTVFSTDIVDGEVKSVDIANNSIHSGDILDNTVNTFDVHSFLGVDVVDETLTGADIQNGSVGSADIAPFSINEGDIASNVIDSRQINNGTLNDEDVGQGTFVHFEASIGTVPANSCVAKDITGINAQGDHLLLTPGWEDSNHLLIYSVQYLAGAGDYAVLNVCNPTTGNITDPATHFNLLVIDAQ